MSVSSPLQRYSAFNQCWVTIELKSGTRLRGELVIDYEAGVLTLLGDCCDNEDCEVPLVYTIVVPDAVALIKMSVNPTEKTDETPKEELPS